MSISVTAMRNRTIMGVEQAWKEADDNFGHVMLTKGNEIFDSMYLNILKEGKESIDEFVKSALKDQPDLLTMNIFSQAFHRIQGVSQSEEPKMCLCDLVHDALIGIIMHELITRGIEREYFAVDENGNVNLRLPEMEAA